MITISVCMIVKNEEKILARCLDCLKGIADEYIIVDTGSTDRTKEIALRYTDKVFDYSWKDDFADARNFSFSKAGMDYIYVADADEIIDEKNREEFYKVKQVLLPEIEIVQMKYCNQLAFGSCYNYDTEYRGKLFKRIRGFVWEDPVHETVRTQPVVYDSDIEIIHMQQESHAGRDFSSYLSAVQRGERLSAKLVELYARELYISGEEEDFLRAEPVFLEITEDTARTLDEVKIAQCVLARCGRLKKDAHLFFTNCIKGVAAGAFSEICFELGEYYFERQEYNEASIWYYNAVNESENRLNLHCAGDLPLERLIECSRESGETEQENNYRKLLEKWRNS